MTSKVAAVDMKRVLNSSDRSYGKKYNPIREREAVTLAVFRSREMDKRRITLVMVRLLEGAVASNRKLIVSRLFKVAS